MERTVLIVDQLEEAKRFIVKDDLSHLRMALLLLDNAAEVIIHRALRHRFSMDDMWSRIFERARAEMPQPAFEEWARNARQKPLPRKERQAIERDFGAKADFLAEEGGVSRQVVRVLKAIHRYRNEAYHRDKIRRETIRPAVHVLFGLVVDMLADLRPGIFHVTPGHRWDDFLAKYGIRSPSDIPEGGARQIRRVLAEGMDLPSETPISLAEHLTGRLDELDRQLTFINVHSVGRFGKAGTLKRVQLWAESKHVATTRRDPVFARYVPPVTLDDVKRWRRTAKALKKQRNLELFDAFADLETQMERLESPVDEIANHIETNIELAVDIARGK